MFRAREQSLALFCNSRQDLTAEAYAKMAVPVPNHISARVSLMQVSQLPSAASSAQEIPIPEPLVQVTRGAITESRHRGHIVAVEPGGKIVALLGAPETVTFLRSSAKPHQAIPLIASGLLTALDLPRKRLHLPVGPIAANPFILKLLLRC